MNAAAQMLLQLTRGCAVHVAWVLEQLRSAPQRADGGALLELKSHLGNLLRVYAVLCVMDNHKASCVCLSTCSFESMRV